MRKDFSIEYRPQIECGEYKVLCEGHKVRILEWSCGREFPIVGIWNNGLSNCVAFFGKDGFSNDGLHRLYIEAPEEKPIERGQSEKKTTICTASTTTDKKDNYYEFRKIAAKDILCSILNANPQIVFLDKAIKQSVYIADRIIRELKEEAPLPTWKHVCTFQSYTDDEILVDGNCLRWGNKVISLDELKKLPYDANN